MKATNKYKVIVENPWSSKGDFFGEDDSMYLACKEYPHLFSQIYELSTGEEVVLGDTVWRVVNSVVKSVKLHPDHIQNNLDVYFSKEQAQKALESQLEKQQKVYESFKLIDYLANIRDIAALPLEKASFEVIKDRMKTLNETSKLLINYFNDKQI